MESLKTRKQRETKRMREIHCAGRRQRNGGERKRVIGGRYMAESKEEGRKNEEREERKVREKEKVCEEKHCGTE